MDGEPRDSTWGPTLPEPVAALSGQNIIDRASVGAFDDPKVAAAIEAPGRKKLIFAGISLEACALSPAITALGKGDGSYVAVDASGAFSQTKREAGQRNPTLFNEGQLALPPGDISCVWAKS